MPNHTANEIEKQFHTNLDRIYSLSDKFNDEKTPDWEKTGLEKEMNRLIGIQEGWSRMYTTKTGHVLAAVIPTIHTKTQVLAENAQIAAKQQQAVQQHLKQDEKAKLKTAAEAIRSDLTRLQNVCLMDYESSRQNIGFAGLVNGIGGNGMYRTAVIYRDVQVDVEAALNSAASHRDRAQFDLAWAKIGIAASKIQNGYEAWNKWQQAREAGAEKTVVTIKVAAAVATLIVTAPYAGAYASSWAYNAALAGAQQLAFEGTTLLARKLDGKDQISPDDILVAVKEVGVAAAAGMGATVVSKALGTKLALDWATKRLGRAPTEQELQFVAKRIEQILVANFAEWSKDLIGLNKQPTWDWYQRVIGPLLDTKGLSVELTKEKDFNKMVYPNP